MNILSKEFKKNILEQKVIENNVKKFAKLCSDVYFDSWKDLNELDIETKILEKVKIDNKKFYREKQLWKEIRAEKKKSKEKNKRKKFK